jgi:uncharacterized membrane protein YhaH (DUF805 family)
MFCIQCGTALISTAKFCHQCGAGAVQMAPAADSLQPPDAAETPVKPTPEPAASAQTGAGALDTPSIRRSFWRHLCTIDGRTGRLTFLAFFAANFFIAIMLIAAIGGPVSSVLIGILALFMLCPTVRRFHDINMSGIFVLTFFVPLVGFIALLALAAIPGTIGVNRFGSAGD